MQRFSLSLFFIILVLLPGCAARITRDGVMSQELPLTLDDLQEIRNGENNHEKVLESYRVYKNPKLQTYLNTIAANVAEVSTRPHLPYHVVLLDDDEVNMFGGPGGYIYMTRGLLNFVESEDEIAGLIAHEIGHIAHYDYSDLPQFSRAKKIHGLMLKGTELARDSIGTYGTATYYAVKGIGKAAPYVSRRFASDAEITADEKAVEYMLAAGYDPRGLRQFIDRLSRVEIGDVGRFVMFMNTHPPFQDRRSVLDENLAKINFEDGSIDFKPDTLAEMRQTTVNPPSSILFVPQLGVHRVTPMALDELQRKTAAYQVTDTSEAF